MAASQENVSMALFCDFENVALGVRDTQHEKFDIKPILERLLLKGSIVVKKAYCDWDRYKSFKATMHEANFELIEIPHVRQSGKNSADIRLVVDALDLCYTKSHVNTFVIISGDSDFSPLVSKLRENAKQVIGIGVKQSTSDLLVANCDEFIFYDDLVRETQRVASKRSARQASPAGKRTSGDEQNRHEDLETRRSQAIEMAVQTFDALVSERGDSGKIWASVLKEAIKRRKPDFSESYYGFRAFGNLLEEAQARGLLEFGRDEKSGAYVYRSSALSGVEAGTEASGQLELERPRAPEEKAPEHESRRRTRGGRKTSGKSAPSLPAPAAPMVEVQPVAAPTQPPEPNPGRESRRNSRGSRKSSAKQNPQHASAVDLPMALAAPEASIAAPVAAPVTAPAVDATASLAAPAERKPSKRAPSKRARNNPAPAAEAASPPAARKRRTPAAAKTADDSAEASRPPRSRTSDFT